MERGVRYKRRKRPEIAPRIWKTIGGSLLLAMIPCFETCRTHTGRSVSEIDTRHIGIATGTYLKGTYNITGTVFLRNGHTFVLKRICYNIVSDATTRRLVIY